MAAGTLWATLPALGTGPVRACPGLPEFAAVLAGLSGDVALDRVLRMMDAALFGSLAGLVAWLAARVSGSVLAGVAAGSTAAVLVGHLPLAPLALSGCVVVLVVVGSPGAAAGRNGLRLTLLVLTAAVTPGLTLAAAAVTGVAVFRDERRRENRLAAATLWALLVLAAGLVGWWSVPLLPGQTSSFAACAVPVSSVDALATLPSSVLASVTAAGPFLVALAALGTFCGVLRLDAATAWPAAALFASAALLELDGPATVLPTVSVAATVMAAIGLRELTQAIRPVRLARPALMVFGIVLVLAAHVRGLTSPGRSAANDADAGVSRAALQRVLALAPDGASLVEEGAAVNLLLRSASWGGAPVPRLIPAAPAVVRAATQAAPVIALPRAQRWLQLRGFEMSDVEGAPGLARVEARGACRALQTTWRRLSDLEATETFALVGASAADTGPILIYALFDARPELFSLDWPADTVSGFRWQRYGPDDESLLADLQRDGVKVDDLDVKTLHGFRLTQSRTATAPLALATTFHRVPRAVYARLTDDAALQRLSLCPAFPHDVVPLADPVGATP